MAKHEVSVTLPEGITVGNVDIEIPVKADGRPMGRLKISKGGVEWLPAYKSVKSHSMTWERFADLIALHGNTR